MRILRILFFLFAILPLKVYADPVACLNMITVNQKNINTPNGWDVMYKKVKYNLVSVMFYDGPPEELASLVNDRASKSEGEESAIWEFPAKSEKGYWISCSYAFTNVVLSKRLPSDISM